MGQNTSPALDVETTEVSPAELRAVVLQANAAECVAVLTQILEATRAAWCPKCEGTWRRVLPCRCPRGCASSDYQFGMPLEVADARAPAPILGFEPGEWVIEVAATLRHACQQCVQQTQCTREMTPQERVAYQQKER